MIKKQEELEKTLWDFGDLLRTTKKSEEFNYLLGLMFFKFLSDELENYNSIEIESDINNEVKLKEILGYYIDSEFRFNEIAMNAEKGINILEDLKLAFKSIEKSTINQSSENAFRNIFSGFNLNSSDLGINKFDNLNFVLSRMIMKIKNKKITGNLFSAIIEQYFIKRRKKGSKEITPKQVSELLSKIVALDKNNLQSIYDPTCGTGSLLIKASEDIKVDKIYGQEQNSNAFNIVRMNLVIHNIKYDNFNIQRGDVLEDPKHLDHKFEAILSHPPFFSKWSASENLLKDVRFMAYDRLAPRSKADYAYIQHMLFQLDDNGVMVVIVPNGLLFRGGAEGKIRENIIKEKNYLDAVIGLPVNLLYGTGIPSTILVFKKSRTDNDNIIFIDATQEFKKSRPNNIIPEESVSRIINAYQERKDIDMFAHAATIDEVQKNKYNLNMPRYVEKFRENPMDKIEAENELRILKKRIKHADKEIIILSKKLGIKPPISIERD